MSFENNIKNWVSVDNKIKILNEQIRELRGERNDYHNKIMMQVENSNLEQSIIQISDGTLKFTTSKSTKPLTLKFIHACLNNVISNQEDVNNIMKYIKGQREVASSKEIKRYYT